MPDFDPDYEGQDYEEWEGPYRELFDELPGMELLREYEQQQLEELFYAGFVDENLSPEDRQAAREEFFDVYGLPEEYFDWEGWREAHNYD